MQHGLVYDYSERFVHLYAFGPSLFTGKERDAESGLDNFGARYAHFVFRTCVDRLAGNGDHTVADEMKQVKVRGQYQVEVRNKKGEIGQAVLQLRYRRVQLLPPIGKQKLYPALAVTILHATEKEQPKDRERVDWKLITDLPVRTRKEAIEKLR